jgi:hypothetical protein
VRERTLKAHRCEDGRADHRDQLPGKIQERYGVAKDEAERQLAAWERSASDACFTVEKQRN